jgi:hypothetical protein
MATLHPDTLERARQAILSRFLEWKTPAGGVVNSVAFAAVRNDFAYGYFDTVWQELANEGCIEILKGGRFARLTTLGFNCVNGL